MKPCHCKDYTRSAIMREAAAKAGGGLRAIEPGMPLPAGTGLSRRAFLARSSGLALAVFGGAALAPAAWDEGIAAAAAAAPDAPVVVSVFMSGGADSLSMLAPVGDSRYASLRPSLAVGAGGGAVRRGPPARLAPAARADPRAARGGQGHGDPGDRLRPPQPVALHLAPLLGGRRAQRGRPRRLDGPLPRPARRRRQPAAGALARLLAGAEPRGGHGPGRRGRLARVLPALDARRVEHRGRRRGALRRARARSRRATRSSPPRATRCARRSRCRSSSGRSPRAARSGSRPPPIPTGRSRAGWPCSPRC